MIFLLEYLGVLELCFLLVSVLKFKHLHLVRDPGVPLEKGHFFLLGGLLVEGLVVQGHNFLVVFEIELETK